MGWIVPAPRVCGLINGVGGIEEDTIPDGTVNLADFARFADNWKTNP